MIKREKLFIINGAQFGHSSGHYYYCKYLRERYSIKYICFDRGLKKISLEGIDILYVPYNIKRLTRMSKFISACISQSRKDMPELLFVTYFNLSFLLPLLCKSKKSILDIRTGSLKPNRIFRNIQNLQILFQSLFFNRIVILSESLRKKLYIPLRNCSVIPLGSDILYPGIHDFSVINLLYIGSLDDRHISDTIRGLGLFLKTTKDIDPIINYTIIGFGSESEIIKLRNCIYENDLIDIVRFEDRKTSQELIPYFEISNIGVVYIPQTPWYDCQPATKLYEYMLSGMPVIATNTYENRLLVKESNNGVLINDTPESFCDGLSKVVHNASSFKSSDIRDSMLDYIWVNIVNSKLRIIFEELLK